MLKTVTTFVHKKGLFWLLSGLCFDYSVHQCHFWRKTFNHLDKRDNDVMCAVKKIYCGLKLLRMETEVATHKCKLL